MDSKLACGNNDFRNMGSMDSKWIDNSNNGIFIILLPSTGAKYMVRHLRKMAKEVFTLSWKILWSGPANKVPAEYIDVKWLRGHEPVPVSFDQGDFYNSQTYVRARSEWKKIHKEQIAKGEVKYPQPLNPETYSLKELIHHAMQENVDQMHYLTALLEKVENLESMLDKEKPSLS